MDLRGQHFAVCLVQVEGASAVFPLVVEVVCCSVALTNSHFFPHVVVCSGLAGVASAVLSLVGREVVLEVVDAWLVVVLAECVLFASAACAVGKSNDSFRSISC